MRSVLSVASALALVPLTIFGLEGQPSPIGVYCSQKMQKTYFQQTDILALGEAHGRNLDSDLRIALIRHPDFARKVRTIVVEFGNKSYQPILDRYIRGEDVPLADLRQVFRNTLGKGIGGSWEFSPLYAQFFDAVREINRKLPADKQVRVLAGDPSLGSDEGPNPRNNSQAAILRAEVLNKGGKALVI